MTPYTPTGTIVLADIVDLYGPGLTAQMTYYETGSGAKVFAGGALDFGGSATLWPVRRMLENLWAAARCSVGFLACEESSRSARPRVALVLAPAAPAHGAAARRPATARP